MHSEVLVIGGGVIGLSIARELYKKGIKEVAIVDRGRCGSESSWAAAGMLAPNIETDATSEFHRLGIEALAVYPSFAEALLDETGIDVELDRSGTLCLAFNTEEEALLSEAYERHRLRGVSVDRLSARDINDAEPAISNAARAALSFPNDWQVENRKLLDALMRFATLSDARIIENTEVLSLITEGTKVVGAATSNGEFRANVTIVATGAWTSFIKIADTSMPFIVKPIRGQMIAFSTKERQLRRVVYSPRGYVVPRADGRVLVGATVEDVGFDKSTTMAGIGELTAAAYEIMPALENFPVTESWAGLRPFAADGLPVIGELPGYKHAFVATAHYRNGILLAPLTAKLIADRIADGIESDYLESFGAKRLLSTANATAN